MFLGGHALSELSGTHITGRTAASATPRFHISFTCLPSFSLFIWAFLRILFPALSSLYLLLGRCATPPSPNAVTLWERQLGHVEPRKCKADLPGSSPQLPEAPSPALISLLPRASQVHFISEQHVSFSHTFLVVLSSRCLWPRPWHLLGLCSPIVPPNRRSLLRLVYFVSLLLSAEASPAPRAHLSAPPRQSSRPPACPLWSALALPPAVF